MFSDDAVRFLNSIPGYYASSPTNGHVAVKSIFWVGTIILYPTTGKMDLSGSVSQGEIRESLEKLNGYQGGINIHDFLLCTHTSDALAEVMVANLNKAPSGS